MDGSTPRYVASFTRPVILAGAAERATAGTVQVREGEDIDLPERSTYNVSCSGFMMAVG